MHEKYTTETGYRLARARRDLLRAVLRPIHRWQPMRDPQPGYSLVIGCPARLVRVLFANLALIRQQRREHLRQIVVGFDVTERAADAALLARLRQRFADLPLKFVFYSRWQARVLDALGWAWCYCWLNWAAPIAALETRYAIVHDLDALLLDGHVLERRYHAIRERGDHFLGVNWYRGNGLTADDRCAVTFEMAFDAALLREQGQPIDLFNRVMRHEGRRVEFDTFLHPQLGLRRSLLPIKAEAMVHPSQLVCQYVELHRRRGYVPPERNNLPMLAYFHFLAGDEHAMAAQARAFAEARSPVVWLCGRTADCRRLSPAHADWLAIQVQRVERAVAGEVRAPVRRYLEALVDFAGRCAGGHEAAATVAEGV